MRSRITFLLWLLAIRCAIAELAVSKPEWGFDGTVIPEAFNLLTVEVRNTGGQPFEGTMGLDDGGGLGGRSVAPYVQQVFIAPGASRAVQFYPYHTSYMGSPRLTWKGQSSGEIPMEPPTGGVPAVVLLADFDAPNLRSLRMRAFNEANFPPTASATDGLHAVVLDHQPRWDPPRREAFLDWLKRGGLVHLIRSPDGTVPQFTGEFAALNVPGATGSVGAGRVVKHEIARTEITADFLKDAGYPSPVRPMGNQTGYDSGDRSIFRQLALVTKPDIAWGLIYTLTLVYVALVGPVFYWLRKRDYRFLLGGFVGTVALFAWAFTIIGRRGYGEKQIYHTVALARSIEGAKWDVRHWIHAFATSGDTYRFTFPGPSHLFAAVGENETVRGEVMQGREGAFSADIPLFSSRPFLHQGVLNGPQLAWQINEFDPDSDQTTVRAVRLTPPSELEILSVVLHYGEKYYPLERVSNSWRLTNRKAVPLNTAFGADDSWQYASYQDTPEVATARLRTSPIQMARVVAGDPNAARPPLNRVLAPGQIRLFTYASAPQAFPVESAEFEGGLGLVLFVQDMTPPKKNP